MVAVVAAAAAAGRARWDSSWPLLPQREARRPLGSWQFPDCVKPGGASAAPASLSKHAYLSSAFGSRGGPGTDDLDVARSEAYLQVVLEERMPVVYTSAGSPEYIVPILHEAGIKSIHIVVSLRHAQKAEAAGVDVIAVGGYEAGGHSQGGNETPVMTLLPQVAGVVKTPVIAGGGVADACGLVAAFALGAEGVTMRTRFAATKESRLHPNMKQAFLDAGDNSTVVWGRKALKERARPPRDMAKLLAGRGGTGLGRTLRNKFSEKYLEMETSGVPVEEVLEFLESYQDPSGMGRDRTSGAILGGIWSGVRSTWER